ncbi:MAG: UvrD-helicase domain-containing protein [Bacilli bacterium]|nr:UvrD-helicase domain-containing protein [Bacilli bacterium]MBP3920039.1 UvrD-helicase domain-containing protein [Bacilli bacterium]
MAWTKEQEQAINKEGSNIIVSAGAGSGKTAVLTARVIRKLETVDINKLLILTFTKEAANEMKERIRKAIKKNPNLKKQLDIIDSAYITTFDSYSLSLVKKYYYLLNLSPNINIIDASIIKLEKEKIIDTIFDELYKEKNTLFEKIITDLCTKDDTILKKYIIELNNKLDLKYDKISYIKTYLYNFYNDNHINSNINEYISIIKENIENLKEELYNISILVDGNYYNKLEDTLKPLLNSDNYNDIKNNINIKIPSLPKGSEDTVKNKKEELNNLIKKIKELVSYESVDEIKESILLTKDYIEIILSIILKLDTKITEYKQKCNMYEFNDISKMAIKILEENESIKNELKNYYNEIMVDEYQDTSDLQEQFINLIEKNNVYMVGDIKQSIYRFRNANPNIFRNKYNKYEKLNGGIKIDLLKNFRSRDEVLNNINLIFNLVMDDKIGGAEYKETHQMIFGNTTYINEGKTKQNYNFSIYNYPYETSEFSKEEIEIFIIANDIKKKINEHYQVFDKDELKLRNIEYKDICIIMDRNTEFLKYKKIFEYLNIPITLYKDEVLTVENDILVLKNIMNLIVHIYNKEFDILFRYYFVSIARSFLFRLSDEEIFEFFINNNFYDNIIYKKCTEICKNLENMTNSEFINNIIEKFDFYSNIIKIGDIEKSMVRIEYLLNLSKTTEMLGYTPIDFATYIKEMVEGNNEIKYSLNTSASNNVKIMNIHKSKGLEFHICYYSGLHKSFNTSDIKQLFTIDSEYGIISPYYKNGIRNTIYKELLKNKYLKEEIAEKIRLFYVAMTRCKEKMIIVTSLNNNEISKVNNIVDNKIRLKYKSFLDILESVKENIKDYIIDISLDELNLNKEYNNIKKTNYKDNINIVKNKIINHEINIKGTIKDNLHFSKTTNKLITKEEYKNMEFGEYMHYILELTDFKNPNYESINQFYQTKIKNFLNQELLKNVKNASIYKEYEFIYEDDNNTYHGIIDLMLEYNDHIDIIDYKLKNINDSNYINQLNGYKNYIYNKTKKETNIYLYSILNDKIEKIN